MKSTFGGVTPRRPNAIHLPSGDHCDMRSVYGEFVSLIGSPAPTSFTYVLVTPPSGPQENTTCVPSGENAGSRSSPRYVVSGTGTKSAAVGASDGRVICQPPTAATSTAAPAAPIHQRRLERTGDG